MSSSSSNFYSESSSSSEMYSESSSSSELYSESSSSSSEGYSESSSSSSSSGYCQYPECSGNICSHLTGWRLFDVSPEVTNNGIIYVKTVFFTSTNTQQVELYKDNTYFNIIALGKITSFIASEIILNEINGSGVTGRVSWDSTPLNFAYSGTIHCIDISSSSSSSSIDSSSTSSASSQSTQSNSSSSYSSSSYSSSSSQCCNTVFCEGASCSHFSNWLFSGMSDSNTTNCNVYIGLFLQGLVQQVRAYKEQGLINLTAVGERSGSGVITLMEENDSGLSGIVTWDGTLLSYPNVLFLACTEFSSSSSSSSSSLDSSSSSSFEYSSSTVSFSTSSSTSSIDSSSSSSSEQYSVSSLSSASISSSSSLTSLSSSSSSSLDSSSTSSESEGNVSSSSSSSGIFWNQAKPLVLGISSAADPNVKNRIAQTFKVLESTYNIGKVYIYLYRARGNTNYWIRMSISDCNDDGTPNNELYLQSIHASQIIKDDWYAFEFDLEGEITPSNGYLSITLRHNGDEDNFVLWGYDEKNSDSETIAWTSNDGLTWNSFDNSVFSLRIIGNFDPFDPVTKTITTPAAPDPIIINDPIIDGKIEYSNAILSFIVDSSGSMGTLDRNNSRQGIVECLINRYKSYYPSDIKFDVFTFGGTEVDVTSYSSNLGSFATINLDLNTPSRTTYIFKVSGSNASVGSIYENNSYQFTVKYLLQLNETSLITNGSTNPISSGTLNLVSGIGDATINFSSFSKVSIDDFMISYGFKNLENNHTYNISDLKVDFQSISPVKLTNWQLFNPNNEFPSISLGKNAPLNDSSIDIISSTNVIARKLFTNANIYQSDMISIVYVGDTDVVVKDASGFSVGDIIDILQGDAANIGLTITNIVGNLITFTPGVNIPITNNAFAGSIVQISSYKKFVKINGTTINLLVRDVYKTRSVIFYLQNSDGYFMEWDFECFNEWINHNVFFFGETAIFPMSFFGKDGTPFPNGTRIDLIVDEKPDLFSENEVDSVNVVQTSFIGQTKIYVSSTNEYFRNSVIDILDKIGNIQTTTITEVSEDSTGPYIDIEDPLIFEVSEALGTTIRINESSTKQITPSDNILSTEVPVVDVTPIVNSYDINPSLLKPYDINRVPPSTPYEDLNTAPEFFQKEIIDMPIINGNVCARVLPIVEDILKTVKEKEEDFSRTQRYSSESDIVSQLEQNEGDQEIATEIPIVEEPATVDSSKDYIIETPVFTSDGLAVSSMQSFSKELTEKYFKGLNIPGIKGPVLLSQDHIIYGSADFLSKGGRTLARLCLEPFDVSFISPIIIDNTYVENDIVQYYLKREHEDTCTATYVKAYVRGHHASDDSTITLNYIVADKFVLATNKKIKITLYANRSVDLEEFVNTAGGSVMGDPPVLAGPYTKQLVNIRSLTTLNTNSDGETTSQQLTDIDLWRESVTNNPFEEVLSSINEMDSALYTSSEKTTTIENDIIANYADLIGATIDSSEEKSEEDDILFYKNAAQWTLAKQYEQYEFTIPIVNGKASITIPNSEVVSLLFVEASVSFGENNQHEHILADMFFVANPITISGLSPQYVYQVHNKLYEIGTSIEYLDGSTVIEDNVQVNFEFKYSTRGFKVEPSSSVTDNGWAGGVFIGPINPIEPTKRNPNAEKECPPRVTIPTIVEVFHPSGYVRRAIREFAVVGDIYSSGSDEDFIFYAGDAEVPLYSDGGTDPKAKITVDLGDDLNPTDIFIGEDGIERLKGFNQPNNLPRTLTAFNCSPRRSTFGINRINLVALPMNKNIGHEQPHDAPQVPPEPWNSEVLGYTSYIRSNGRSIRGLIASGLPYPGVGGLIIPKPFQKYKEPLNIKTEFETNFIRDGITSATIYSEITWKNKPITNKFVINEGTESESIINYPFPKVTFESGTSKEENIEKGEPPQMKDTRNTILGCLTVAPHRDIILSDYSVQSGLFRSSIYTEDSYSASSSSSSSEDPSFTSSSSSSSSEDPSFTSSGINIHTHATNIDADGSGLTTTTIILSGTVVNHSHTFTNYESDEQLGHAHGLRCVAITTILPTNNIDTDFVVNGTVVYDPTNCEPYENEPVNLYANRKMFSTLRVPAGRQIARRLDSRVEFGNDLNNGSPIFVLDYKGSEKESSSSGAVGPAGSEEFSATFYTARSIDETYRGFDIRIFVKFPEYRYVDDIGNLIIVPEEIVPDGSRVTLELLAYKSEEEGADLGFLVMGAGFKRPYMSIKAKVSVTCDGYLSERQFAINISSIQQWYPAIKHQVPQLTNDDIYLTYAISKFEFFGSSQIHDAVTRAAEQLVQYQTDDINYKDYKKVIILLTDGDENYSDSSLNQAIDAVNFIDGKDQVQIVPIQLGQPHASDSVLLEKYSKTGNSSVFYLDTSTDIRISEVCETIVSENNSLNRTILSGEVVFEVPSIPIYTALTEVTAPIGSGVTYRIRTSIDNISFTDWNYYIDYSIPFKYNKSLDLIQKYIQYEIKLVGNSYFESPVINGGIEVSYYDPREFVIFFKPIPVDLNYDEYISSIHLTCEADIPENSTVEFLMTQSDSLNVKEYYNIIPDQHTIIPTRFNELLLTNDFKTYTATNGRWNGNFEIKVYRINKNNSNGVLVNQSEYAANNIEGSITFLSSQDPSSTIFIDIFFASSFRIAARVINFADDAAVIHHIGIMYNISKRIPRSELGTILNVPISKRLTS